MPEARQLEATLRRVVADEIAEQRRRAESSTTAGSFDAVDQRQMARAILNRELDLRAREAMRLGEQPLTDGERTELMERVLAQAFSALPGLERFVNRDDAINIHVQGSREVVVELIDGTRETHPSPFSSDEELIGVVAQVARRSGTVEKEFNYSHPMLHLTLAVDDRVVARVVVAEQHELRRPRHERRSSDRNVGTRPDRGRQHNSGDPPGASPARSRELHGGTIPVHEAPLVAVLFRAS